MLRQNYEERQFKVYGEISKRIKNKLEATGELDEKVVMAIIDKHTKHLKGEEFVSRSHQLLTSHLCNYELPPLIVPNNIELKLYLSELAKEFSITGSLDTDNGHFFTYQISVHFPSHFQM